MRWTDCAVAPYFSWPNRQIEFTFEGRRLVLQPLTPEHSCTVSVYDENGLTFDEGGSIICRFLSLLAWSKNAGVAELFMVGSNNPTRPGLLGRGTYPYSPYGSVEPWEYLYLPSPPSERAALAVALYREGMSVNVIPFSFLSFFKIVNILHSHPDQQMAWINQALSRIPAGATAAGRLVELRTAVPDVGKYLYVQGRCAVSHAFAAPLVNPDSYEDKKRLEKDLPLMKELAALCIEDEFGVASDSSFWESLRRSNGMSQHLLKRKVSPDGGVLYAPEAGA